MEPSVFGDVLAQYPRIQISIEHSGAAQEQFAWLVAADPPFETGLRFADRERLSFCVSRR